MPLARHAPRYGVSSDCCDGWVNCIQARDRQGGNCHCPSAAGDGAGNEAVHRPGGRRRATSMSCSPHMLTAGGTDTDTLRLASKGARSAHSPLVLCCQELAAVDADRVGRRPTLPPNPFTGLYVRPKFPVQSVGCPEETGGGDRASTTVQLPGDGCTQDGGAGHRKLSS